MAGPAWMSKVSAGRRAAATRGGGPEAAMAPWRARSRGVWAARARTVALEEGGDDEGEGEREGRGPTPAGPPGRSPGPASSRTGRGWARSALAEGRAPTVCWARPGHLAGRGSRQERSCGGNRRFLPGFPAPHSPARPGLPLRLGPLRRAPCPLGLPPGPAEREQPAAPHLFWGENPRPGAGALLTAGMPPLDGAPGRR